MLRLQLESTPPHQDELWLRFGDWSYRCDAYFFALDRGISPEDDSPAKVRQVLVRLLEQWYSALAAAVVGEVVYLPFDFADQSTAWLRAEVTSTGVNIVPGWSEVEGWSFFPSNIGERVHQLSDFEPIENIAPLSGPHECWLHDITASLEAARSTTHPTPVCSNMNHAPRTDATPLFELLRGSYGSELLTAAVAHFQIFGLLGETPLGFEELRQHLRLSPRPLMVLLTALRAMKLLEVDTAGVFRPTDLAREHLTPGAQFDVGDYICLAAMSPGVQEMISRLRSNLPRGADGDQGGVAFIHRDGVESAMNETEAARHFTLALAGRARNVAPALAAAVPLAGAGTLLDVAGGTGLYALEFLRVNPGLTATVFDRPEVLKVAEEFRDASPDGERLQLVGGDMFHDPLPPADVVLLSNVLHDWDIPECRQLVKRCADALPSGGRLLIHDVFLNDDLSGPLPIALYSAALFTLTEGRAYSAAEYRGWLEECGLSFTAPIATHIHCGVIVATKN